MVEPGDQPPAITVSPPDELTLTDDETLPPAERTVMPRPVQGRFLLLTCWPLEVLTFADVPAVAEPCRLPAVTDTLCAAAGASDAIIKPEKISAVVLM